MSDARHPLLTARPLLDIQHPDIEALVASRGWRALAPYDRIGAMYDFVRNEIAIGYNAGDELPASRVLTDGIGQCNTQSTLLMALLRAVGIPRRFHGFTIDKTLQKGAITGLAYWLAPQRIIHSWVEVASTDAGSHSKASSSTRLTSPASSAAFLTLGASAALAPPRPTRPRLRWNGVVRTRTSRRKALPMTSVPSKARTPSTHVTGPI